MDWTVGIGEYVISGEYGDKIRTYALASCVAVTLYSPENKVLAMAHIALPTSSIDEERGVSSPGYFADTAVPLMVNKLCREYGCKVEELRAILHGGAQSGHKEDYFRIGERNIRQVEGLLNSYNIPYCKNNTGGSCSRTLEAEVGSGEIKVSMLPMQYVKG